MPPSDQKKIDEMFTQMTELQNKVKLLETNGNNQPKNDYKADKTAIVQAKSKVPELIDDNSFPDFLYYLKSYLNLKENLNKFIKAITIPDANTVTSKKLISINKEALKLGEKVSTGELNDFKTWIITKINEKMSNIHKSVDEDLPVHEQILMLWYNIKSRFNRNSTASRNTLLTKLMNLKQPEECVGPDSVINFYYEVHSLVKNLNGLWMQAFEDQYGKAGHPKYHDSEIWTKFLHGLNSFNKQTYATELTRAEEKKTLPEQFAYLSGKLLDDAAKGSPKLEEANFDTDEHNAYMARTNKPTTTAANSEYSRVRMHRSDMKTFVCRNFNGTPNSCSYGHTCKFRHITNAQERETALKQQAERYKLDKQAKKSKVRAMLAEILSEDGFEDGYCGNDDLMARLSDSDSDFHETKLHELHYDQNMAYPGNVHNQVEPEGEVLASLAMSAMEHEVSDVDSDVEGTLDNLQSEIEKEMSTLHALRNNYQNEQSIELKITKKQQLENKRLNILLEKAKRKNEKMKNDFQQLLQIKQNVLKEEMKVKKLHEENRRKKEEKKLKDQQQIDRKKEELEKIYQEMNKYKEYKEQALKEENELNESKFSELDDFPPVTKRSRACPSLAKPLAWSIKWLFLILTGIAIFSAVCHAVVKIPEYVSSFTAETIHPSTAKSINREFDVGHSFIATKTAGRKYENRFLRSTGLTILDSGTTWHLTGNRSKFIGKLTPLSRPRKIIGFNSTSTDEAIAKYKGTIEISTVVNGRVKNILLNNVLYVPCMKSLTLVSQGQLDDEGHAFINYLGKGRCISPNTGTFFETHKQHGLYHIGKPEMSLLTFSKDMAHRKFGHVNEKDLDALGDWSGELSP